MVFPAVMFLFRFIKGKSAAFNAITAFLKLFPPYLLGHSIVDIPSQEFFRYKEGTSKEYSNLDWDVNGQNLLYFVFDAFFYFWLIFVLEKMFKG